MEHEKLGVHARPLSDSLVGVPFKKRRFLFTRSPSPPPQLPSLTDDCDVQCKPESSELGSTVSETCSHPVQLDTETGNKSSCTGKVVPLDSGEEPKTRDVTVSPKHDTLLVSGDPGLDPDMEANSNAAHTEQEMALKTEILPFTGSSQMQETLEVPKKVGSDEGVIVKSEGSSVPNNKMLPVMESTQFQSVMQETLEVAQKAVRDEGKMVCSEGMKGKVVPLDSGEGQKTRDVTVSPKHDTLLVSGDPGLDPDMEANSNAAHTEQEMALKTEILPFIGSSQMQETLEVPKKVGSDEGVIVKSEGTSVSNNKMLPVMESTQLQSVMQETLEVAQNAVRDEGKMVCSEEISLSEDRFSDTDLRVDSNHLSRSNWDLNTTMDAWEGSNTGISVHGLNQSTVMSEHIKGLDLSLNQSLYGGPNEANLKSGNCNLQTNGNDHRLLNQSTVVNEHSNTEACLDLQLKPSSLSNAYSTSANLNAPNEKSFLSLSVKPTTMISSHNPQLAISREIKPEPYERGHWDIAKADKVQGPNSEVLKHVKSEPCECHNTSKTTVSSNSKSVCGIAIKQEQLGQSQGSHRSPEGTSFPINLGGHSLSPQSTGIIQSAGKFDVNSPDPTCKSPQFKSPEGKAFQMYLGGHDSSIQNTESNLNSLKVDGNPSENTCKSLESDERNLHSDAELNQNSLKVDGNPSENTCKSLESDERNLHSDTKHLSRHVSEDYTMVDTIQDIDNQIPAPNSYLPPDTVMPNPVEDFVATRPIISDGNELNSVKELCEADSLPLLPECLASECKEYKASDVADSVAQVYSSGAFNSSEITPIDEQLSAQYENENVKNNEIKDQFDTSPVTLEGNCEYESKVDICHGAAGGIKTLHKERGTVDEDYEDGEVRDLGLNTAVEGPCKETQGNVEEQLKYIHQPITPVPLSVPDASYAEEKEISIHNMSDAKGHDTVVCEIGPCDDKDRQGSSSEVFIRISPKSQPSKTVRKRSAIKKHKGPEGIIKSDASHSTKSVIKGDQVDVSNQQEKPEGMLSEVSELCKTESSQADSAPKDVTGTSQHSRIIYLNSTSNISASEKMKPKAGRPSLSPIERGIPVDRSFIRERVDSRGSRDEPSKFEVDRSHFHQGGRRVTDFMQNRCRNDERRIALRGDINTDSDQLPKNINSFTGVQYPRGRNDSEIANDASSNGCNLNMRKQTNHGFQNVSRIPIRGRSPGPRGHGMMVHHPTRDISPRRCIGREVPDFVLAHEENLMRNLPNDMVEPPIPPHPRSQYERSASMLIRRERRSLSPTQRRGGVVHLPVNCTKSSSRAQQSSPHQWMTPERCPESYYAGPRSPQMDRPDRMRPQHQRPCYQDEMVIRRRASPQYSDQISDDGMNMVAHAREHDLPRRDRGSNRNMRRFNLLDPREISEENYFGPPLYHSQIREFAEEDGYVDGRCEERRGPVRSFRQRCVSDDDGEDFRFRVESGPSRPFRLCPEGNEGFPEGGNPRDFNGRLRNRLGNRCGRSRGIVQEQDINYPHHEGQVWHDAGYGDARVKKRRF